MAAFTTCHGPVEVPDYVIAAVTRRAELLAERTAAFLHAIGVFPTSANNHGRSGCLTAGMLLDVGALMQIAIWNQSDIREFLPEDTPSVEQATDALRCRLTDIANGRASDGSQLQEEVFRVWFETVAWDGQLELQADFVVGEIDEDVLIDAVAELIWAHRHDQTDASKIPTTVVES